jgi:hypothetical protein
VRWNNSIVVLIALSLASCGHLTQEDVARMKNEVKFAKRDLKSSQRSLQPMQDYIGDLQQGTPDDATYLMVSPSDIKKAGIKAFIPYKFPAKSIHNKISGKLTTKKILSVQVLHSNKLKISLLIVGKNIKVHYKGNLYKPHIKKIKQAIQAGMRVDLIVNLSMSKTGNSLIARVRCKDLQLKKHNESTYRNNIKGAVNASLGKKKYVIPLALVKGKKPRQLITTAHHVIVKYD